MIKAVWFYIPLIMVLGRPHLQTFFPPGGECIKQNLNAGWSAAKRRWSQPQRSGQLRSQMPAAGTHLGAKKHAKRQEPTNQGHTAVAGTHG